MARQVAHEIKNPLTPIQLNAEHLRRVNADRGEPLSPILEQSVSTILAQVKLLRQIASEFSSFASSPTVQRAPVDIAALLHEIVDPYRSALEGQIHFHVDVPSNLPPVYVDRTLITRALTNIVENALHAMGSRGTLTIVAMREDDRVRHSASRIPEREWMPTHSRARSSPIFRRRRAEPDWDCRSRNGTWS